MIGLIRLILKFTWLGIMVLGARQLVEFLQQGMDSVVEQIDQGESSGMAGRRTRHHPPQQVDSPAHARNGPGLDYPCTGRERNVATI